MPKILIVSATRQEIEPFLSHFDFEFRGNNGFYSSRSNPHISVLITGVGMVNTAYFMGRYFLSAFDLTINMGVCGAFNRDLKIGEVVNVVDDTISEMGAEDGNEFIKYSDLNLGGTNRFTDRSDEIGNKIEKLKKVSGITVNTVHGNDENIKKAIQLFNAD